MTETIQTDLLIVGAGPFGLSLAAAASERGIDHIVAGEPMSFWRQHMPAKMLLRSDPGWHLDRGGVHTIEAFLKATGQEPAAARPLSRDLYLEYCAWFQERKDIRPRPDFVDHLTYDAAPSRFLATTASGTYNTANVVLAVGFAYFKNVPAELADKLPKGRFGHTCDVVDFESFDGRDVLIIGGRQSAFENAALIAEAGARSVHLSYRHETPAFEKSDWGWVDPLMTRFLDDPGWFRRLSSEEKAELNRRFWAEGRLRLEPWLAPRIDRPKVHLHPKTAIAGYSESDGRLHVDLDSGGAIEVDDVLLATGYRVDVEKLPFLTGGDLLERLDVSDGFPALSERFESSVPGLYFTSMAATRDFGSFFGFTVSAPIAAQIIADAVQERLKS